MVTFVKRGGGCSVLCCGAGFGGCQSHTCGCADDCYGLKQWCCADDKNCFQSCYAFTFPGMRCCCPSSWCGAAGSCLGCRQCWGCRNGCEPRTYGCKSCLSAWRMSWASKSCGICVWKNLALKAIEHFSNEAAAVLKCVRRTCTKNFSPCGDCVECDYEARITDERPSFDRMYFANKNADSSCKGGCGGCLNCLTCNILYCVSKCKRPELMLEYGEVSYYYPNKPRPVNKEKKRSKRQEEMEMKVEKLGKEFSLQDPSQDFSPPPETMSDCVESALNSSNYGFDPSEIDASQW